MLDLSFAKPQTSIGSLPVESLRRIRPSPGRPEGGPASASTRSSVRRYGSGLDDPRVNRRITPDIFRHTAAVHLLEAGVDVNVIRGWLGHADLSTTNRYAEINTKTKEAALRALEPPTSSAERPIKPVWRSDESLLKWLASL